mmetsp:Transcript_8808/g.19051  ORF Transcript_8808/g.19051 Transcript_8808/m.19051 type:complete len:406 (-) Transcript_8808:187-1404(-)|eukprot:CAMPEP_0168750584 /NCGR_PEP_ID=MMETSP0724-20121128/17355_1 /TAXON_ID=265536 /ORGANISM="Amphiprora sp., Strain CCMP467" /LENGTH=405 /DNA_ID=CAMNT_0008798625 /DNA_START=59 /DNA_END=1276 /DNA_ORIENTATION=+
MRSRAMLLFAGFGICRIDAFLIPKICDNSQARLYGTQPTDSVSSPIESYEANSTSRRIPTLSETEEYRSTLLRLANWSLEDYKWRSSVFKANEADRMVEETIARMQGKDPTYVRPMDASDEKIGPLGRWEKSAVDWLAQVIDEEGRRAKKIVDMDGKLIRPIEGDTLGPLGQLEQAVTEWLRSIRSSENARVMYKTMRPMDLEESLRGPLGRMEEAASRFFRDVRESEFLRLEQSKARGGAVVRPIDVPGPLGELELWIAEVLKAEELRAMESKDQTDDSGYQIVRPKDAKVRGPLGETEKKAFEFLDRLNAEEMERLRNIRQYLREARPMDTSRDSILGVVEAVVVGIIRSPLLLLNVVQRVRELVDSRPLEEAEQLEDKSKSRTVSLNSSQSDQERKENGSFD